MENRQRLAELIIQVIPNIMRTLASEWRHVEQSLMPGHFRILFILTHGPQNLSDLANKLEVSLPTMSNSISTLCDREWVVRHRDTEDRRRVLVELTPEGLAMLDHIRQRGEEHLERMLHLLSNEDCKQAILGLEALQLLLSADSSCSLIESAATLGEPAES